MLSRLFKRNSATPAVLPAASIPAGQRVYAVGDIHGRLDLLEELLALIAKDDAGRPPAETRLIFLGDLIDRGPESAGVVERLRGLALQRPSLGLLLGNHEEVFLAALREEKTEALRFFCRIGGRETILSYGISETDYNAMDYGELKEALQARVPESHVKFLEASDDMIEIGSYLFVHAGIRPNVALEEQRPRDLRWIREPFLDHTAPHSHIVVHGHTITPDVEDRGNRIGIDTGAYASGMLTAIGMEGSTRWFLQTSDPLY